MHKVVSALFLPLSAFGYFVPGKANPAAVSGSQTPGGACGGPGEHEVRENPISGQG